MLIPTLVACKDAIPGPQGEQGIQGESGKDGVTPTIEISSDGYWVINGVKTEHKAVGEAGKDGEKGDTGADGDTPVITISDDGYWVVNGVKTEYKAVGQDGEKGDKGDKGDPGNDGITPTVAISDDGYWIINGVKTSVKAVGEDGENGAPGETPTIAISDDGYWVINGVKTATKAIGEDGENGAPGETPTIEISSDGYWVINGVKTTTKAVGKDGENGAPGVTPTIEISEDGYWIINGVKSEVKAVGKDGENGAPGVTPTISISEDGYWIINGATTEFKAIGVDGVTPVISISDDGYWVINGEKTEYRAVCRDCDDDDDDIDTPEQGSSGFVMPEGGYDGSAVTIRFYHNMGTRLQSVLNTAISDFNKIYPNIKIEHKSLGDYNGIRDKIKTEIAVGNQPHLALCYSDHVALYNKAGAVQTLDVFISDENVGFTQAELDDFVEAFYNEGRMLGDGMMYSLPVSKSTEVLYYNKTFFEEHNLEVPTTWDEMEEVCRRIKEIDPDSIPLGYDSEANWFITMCEQYGSPYTSATGQKYLFNNQTNIDFVTRFRTWYQNKWVTTEELSGGYTSSLFTGDGSTSSEGSEASRGTRCYMSIGSTGGAAYMQPNQTNGQFEFEVGITSIPQVNPAEPKVISQGPSICMFEQDNPQEMVAAWLFAKFLTTDHAFQGGYSMANGYAPVIKSVVDNPTYAQFLAQADENGTANITAYAVKVAIEQQNAYFASPAFDGSSVARDQVGLLIQKVFTLPAEGLTEAIQKAFEDAVDECEYQAPSEIIDDGGISLPIIPVNPGIPEDYVAHLTFSPTLSRKYIEVQLHAHIDADTTHFMAAESDQFSISQGDIIKVRYLAVNTPESTGVIEPWGKKASEFVKERLTSATSIIIESNYALWDLDASGRFLVWVWYKAPGSTEYRNLNIELIQEGFSTQTIIPTCAYENVANKALNQAKALEKNVWSSENDPDFAYNAAKSVTLKELRTNIDDYVGAKVAFEGVITYNSDYTAYIEEYDPETDMYFGMQLFYGYDSRLIEVLAPGNRVRIVGTVSEFYGTYQVSSLTYNPMRPDDPANTTVISEGGEVAFRECTPAEFYSNVTIEDAEGNKETVAFTKLAVSTSISMKNLVVKSVYVTSYSDEMTLTCELDGQIIEVRTAFSEEKLPESAEEYFVGQTIDVRGIIDYFDLNDTGNGKYQIRVYPLSDITIH